MSQFKLIVTTAEHVWELLSFAVIRMHFKEEHFVLKCWKVSTIFRHHMLNIWNRPLLWQQQVCNTFYRLKYKQAALFTLY